MGNKEMKAKKKFNDAVMDDKEYTAMKNAKRVSKHGKKKKVKKKTT